METLYNGITLPKNFPPVYSEKQLFEKTSIPYLENPPEVIDITVGRQLFVDDFLIEESSLTPEYHKAKKLDINPVFKPETPWETEESLPCATPKSGGVWYDEKEQKFKMWYEAGWLNQMCYAESSDGINWTRPDLDLEKGTNKILIYKKNKYSISNTQPEDLSYFRPDSTTVFIDNDCTDLSQRYKMFLRSPGYGSFGGILMTSADGIHWDNQTYSSSLDDRSTVFYNPFRKKWVYSIRESWDWERIGRVRSYAESDDFLAGGNFENSKVKWLMCDKDDKKHPSIGFMPQLYNVDAVGYESIMLGMFQILYGPENGYCNSCGMPKITELMPMYSRDGFHFSRPCRNSIIPSGFSEENCDAWDFGYIQSVGGICIIHNDELRIYYIGFSGDKSKTPIKGEACFMGGTYSGGSTGIATLRRDGFVSQNSENGGILLTRNIKFSSVKKYMFANFIGSLKAEIITSDGVTALCHEVSADSTKQLLDFGNFDIAALSDRPFRIKFYLTGKLYAFWFAESPDGKSGGYTAGGKVKS